MSGLLLLGYLTHAWRHGRVGHALWGALGIGAATVALLLTESRASLLVYGVALLAFGLRSWRTALAAGGAVAAAGAALVAVPGWGARLMTAFQVQPNMDRILIWRASWHMLRDHPWFGIGGGTFVKLYPAYRLDPYHWPVSMPHNLELNVAVQLGIVGLALFVSVTVLGALQLRGRPQRRSVYGGALFAVAALLLRDQVDITLFKATVAAPFWVLGGLLLAWPRSVAPGSRLPHEPLAGP
ncbi:MAG TPA: O-antigen ligase family protein, partial [Limnochordia bacterium]|nr:O-antigen ligase family protein [Limnochordia bacterium]